MKNWACADHFCLRVSSMSTLLWLHLTPDCLYWDMVRVSVRDPLGLQLKWCQLCPALRYFGLHSCGSQPGERGSQGTLAVSWVALIQDQKRRQELLSCFLTCIPAVGKMGAVSQHWVPGAVRISNSLGLNGGLDYMTVVQRLLAAVYHP